MVISNNGNVGIGTTDTATYKLNVAGDVSITGDYRKGTALYKPAGAVLADTTTALATTRTIAGTSFNGTENINLNYFSITNIPIILLLSTTNLQVDSSKNLIVGSVVSGTIERLSVGGNIRATGTITADTNLVVGGSVGIVGTGQFTGNVGIGVAPHATYKLDVNGTLNATSILVNNTVISDSKWSGTTNIYYNGGNVAIGTSDATTYKLRVEGGNIFTTNPIYFNNNYYGGGADVTCNKIFLFGQGAGQSGFGVSSSATEYFSAQFHRFYWGTTIGGANRGNSGMTLNNNDLSITGTVSCNGI